MLSENQGNNKDTVLVVDDNKNNLDLMLVTLSEENFRLLAATSGERALKIAQKVQPDLILMDIQMPGIDGYETARKMKSELGLYDVPILFLSALNDLNNIVQCFAAGGVDYISKPFKKEELLARVKTHLRIKHLQTGIRGERDRIETILKSILPNRIIEKLKEGNEPEPEYFEDATVLFTDFVGFTGLIKESGASTGIEQLNKLFSAFDEITNHFGLERVKTIGDAYMAVVGVNTKPDNPEVRAILAALKLREAVQYFNDQKISDNEWALRVGMHTGPVIAGVIGNQRIAFDVWGNTVNVSSRLESISAKNSITISNELYSRVNQQVLIVDKGEKDLHNWGKMHVFEVDNTLKNIAPHLLELYHELNVNQLFDAHKQESDSLLNQLFDLRSSQSH
ncbi:adenylate/guanylate cyclase domain-containing response regulator [bacterium]|nr:MAG: adenylate/guanylate cyclase domain-containing response regulator [bacterium]